MRLEKLWDDLRTTLWFRSAVWVILLGLLARSVEQNLVEPNDRLEINKRLLAAAEMLQQEVKLLSISLDLSPPNS